MIINLFVLIISYFIFFLTILGSGILLNNFVIKEKDISLGETGIFGFINIYFIILIIHFFSLGLRKIVSAKLKFIEKRIILLKGLIFGTREQRY